MHKRKKSIFSVRCKQPKKKYEEEESNLRENNSVFVLFEAIFIVKSVRPFVCLCNCAGLYYTVRTVSLCECMSVCECIA